MNCPRHCPEAIFITIDETNRQKVRLIIGEAAAIKEMTMIKETAFPVAQRMEKTGGRIVKDTEILDLYWGRDERAITETQHSYGKYCHSIAYHILHNSEDSEECVNDTWLRAWYAIPPKKPERLSLFLGTITRNLSFDLWKRKNAGKRGTGKRTWYWMS